MRTWIERGGWYGDNDLEGNYVSLHRDSHISVNGTRVELPGENVLYLVYKNWRGQDILFGQGHISGKAWLYRDRKWESLGVCIGIGAFGYKLLYIVTGKNTYQVYDLETAQLSSPIWKQLGSMGIYYITDESFEDIVTYDEAYGPGPYNLALWIKRGSIVIGQGYDGGCKGLLGADYRLVEPGDCQFLKFYYDKGMLAITIVKMKENTTVFYWMSVAEFLSLHIVDNNTNPIPIPPPVPVPIPPNPIPPSPIPTPIPVPEPTFKPIKELKLMEPETVSIIGPGNKFLRLVNNKPVFDADTESTETDFIVSKPDDRFALMKDGLYL